MFAVILFLANVFLFAWNLNLGFAGYTGQFFFAALSLFCSIIMYKPALAYLTKEKENE